jgi:hypothetical protein
MGARKSMQSSAIYRREQGKTLKGMGGDTCLHGMGEGLPSQQPRGRAPLMKTPNAEQRGFALAAIFCSCREECTLGTDFPVWTASIACFADCARREEIHLQQNMS